MKTSMMRALVITVAVLTLGLLSMSKVNGQGTSNNNGSQEATPVQQDPQKAYLDSYKKAFDNAKTGTQKALESQGTQDSGSSGGSCG